MLSEAESAEKSAQQEYERRREYVSISDAEVTRLNGNISAEHSAIDKAADGCEDEPAQKKIRTHDHCTWDLRDLCSWKKEEKAAIVTRDEANTLCDESLRELKEATRYKCRLEHTVEVLRSQGSHLHAPYVDLSHLYLSILVRIRCTCRSKSSVSFNSCADDFAGEDALKDNRIHFDSRDSLVLREEPSLHTDRITQFFVKSILRSMVSNVCTLTMKNANGHVHVQDPKLESWVKFMREILQGCVLQKMKEEGIQAKRKVS